MAHAIEQFEDGTAAFFSARVPAWHRLGTVTEDAQTAADALRIAQMDWHVYKTTEPLTMTAPTSDGVVTVPVPSQFATYRTHPKTGVVEPLGVVGTQYTPIQNSEAFDFLSLLVDEHGAVFDTAGSLHGGKKVFVTMKMPQDVLIGGFDAVDMYLLATNAHDGSGAFQVAVTPTRVVCQNTLTWGLKAAKRTMSFRHTRNVTNKVQAARETLGLTFAYSEEFEKAAEELLAKSMTDKQFLSFAETLFPERKDPSSRQVNRRDEILMELNGLWNAPTQENIKGTKWAAYNTVVEWADWLGRVKGRGDEAKADKRAIKVREGGADGVKSRALALL